MIFNLGSNTPTLPEFTYSGSYEFLQDDKKNWRIKFLTSGTLKFTKVGNAKKLDVFCVGGGGGVAATVRSTYASGGGGGGYTKTETVDSIEKDVEYSIVIGEGGGKGTNGGATSAFGVTANGGNCAKEYNCSGGDGGSGGGGYVGDGGSDGGDGTSAGVDGSYGGKGQGTTTREFGEPGGTLYAGGGASYNGNAGAGGGGASNSNAAANTGGGAGGSYLHNAYTNSHDAKYGGSGIVVIRNHRK